MDNEFVMDKDEWNAGDDGNSASTPPVKEATPAAESVETPVVEEVVNTTDDKADKAGAPIKEVETGDEKITSIADAFKKLKGEEVVADLEKSKVIVDKATKSKGKDWTGLEVDEPVKAILKDMTTQAFEYVKPRLIKQAALEKELGTLKEQIAKSTDKSLPANYWEHPEAYTLDEGYKKSVTMYQSASKELNFWQEQFVKVREGQDWVDYQQNATGQLVPVQVQASANAELILQERINLVKNVMQQEQQKVNSLQTSFKTNVESKRKLIQERTDSVFPDYKDEAKRMASPYYKTLHEAFKEQGLDTNVLADGYARLYSEFMILKNKYNEKISAGAKQVSAAEATKKRGPTGSEINTGSNGAKKPVNGESLSDIRAGFSRLKEGY